MFPFLSPIANSKVHGEMDVAATGADVGITISAFVSVSAAKEIGKTALVKKVTVRWNDLII